MGRDRERETERERNRQALPGGRRDDDARTKRSRRHGIRGGLVLQKDLSAQAEKSNLSGIGQGGSVRRDEEVQEETVRNSIYFFLFF